MAGANIQACTGSKNITDYQKTLEATIFVNR